MQIAFYHVFSAGAYGVQYRVLYQISFMNTRVKTHCCIHCIEHQREPTNINRQMLHRVALGIICIGMKVKILGIVSNGGRNRKDRKWVGSDCSLVVLSILFQIVPLNVTTVFILSCLHVLPAFQCVILSLYLYNNCLQSPYLHQSHELINGLLFCWELFLQAICHLSLPTMDMILPEWQRSKVGCVRDGGKCSLRLDS